MVVGHQQFMNTDMHGKSYQTVGDLPIPVETHVFTNWLKSLDRHQLRLLIYKQMELECRKDKNQLVFDFPL